MRAPFRAEHIGSLLRPAALLEARRQYERREITREQLRASEDQAIGEAVDLQARAGLGLATDGEFRRRSYHSYFYRSLGDITPDAVGGEAGGALAARRPADRGDQQQARLDATRSMSTDFKRLRALTRAMPKITIPGPCAVHFRGGDAAVTAHAYRDVDEFWDDIVAAFRAELHALAAAGCTYVQIDETAFAKFGDPDVQADARGARRRLVAADRHLYRRHQPRCCTTCRRRSTSACICAGETAAATGMPRAATTRSPNGCSTGSPSRSIFLEYDSPRAGDFSPLRHVPAGKHVVLGLVSTKTAALEDKDDLQAPPRCGQPPCRPRAAVGQPAMRLRQRRRGQSDHAAGPGGKAQADRRARARGLGNRLTGGKRDNRCQGCTP